MSDDFDDIAEKYIHDVFKEELGFSIEKIPELNRKTPDFKAHKCGENFLIEVKSKHPNRQDSSNRKDVLLSGQVWGEKIDLVRTKNYTKNISEAKNQLTEDSKYSEYFKLVCFVVFGFNANARIEQIIAGTYGRETIADWSNSGPMMHCYYFSESDFYRYRNDIDGLILVDANIGAAHLCLNDHSSKYAGLSKSSLSTAFEGGVLDPQVEAQIGEAMIVEGNIDRSDRGAVLTHVKEKYGLGDLTMTMPMKQIMGETLLN